MDIQRKNGAKNKMIWRMRGWIASFGGTSDNNRKAKHYRLTPAGRMQLIAQTAHWEQLVRTIGRIVKPVSE